MPIHGVLGSKPLPDPHQLRTVVRTSGFVIQDQGPTEMSRQRPKPICEIICVKFCTKIQTLKGTGKNQKWRKVGILKKKQVLYIWAIVLDGEAVDLYNYYEQLDGFYAVLSVKYLTLIKTNEAIFQHDNTPAQHSCLSKVKLLELQRVNILSHPVYSPDIATSDNGLLSSKAHLLKGFW